MEFIKVTDHDGLSPIARTSYTPIHYRVGKTHSVAGADVDETVQCSTGLHVYRRLSEGVVSSFNNFHRFFLVDVEVKDILYFSDNDAKVRVRSLKVVKEMTIKEVFNSSFNAPEFAYHLARAIKYCQTWCSQDLHRYEGISIDECRKIASGRSDLAFSFASMIDDGAHYHTRCGLKNYMHDEYVDYADKLTAAARRAFIYARDIEKAPHWLTRDIASYKAFHAYEYAKYIDKCATPTTLNGVKKTDKEHRYKYLFKYIENILDRPSDLLQLELYCNGTEAELKKLVKLYKEKGWAKKGKEMEEELNSSLCYEDRKVLKWED